jgi:Dihaem cytochrome c
LDLRPAKAWRWAALGLVGVLGLWGCVTLPPLTQGQLAAASARWPDTDAGTLESGRTLYKTRCNQCHGIMAPETLVKDKWEDVFEEMSENAELKPDDVQRVYRFLWTMTLDAGSR